MAIEYLGLSEVNGPLVVLEGVQDAAYDEIVEFTVKGTGKKLGRIIEAYADKAVIQVFEGTEGMSLENTRTRLTGHPMEAPLSETILGRVFDGIGRPIDGMGPVSAETYCDVNGLPLNPCRNFPFSPETACRMTGSRRRLSNRQISAPIQAAGSASFLQQWGSNTTWRTISAGPLKKAASRNT